MRKLYADLVVIGGGAAGIPVTVITRKMGMDMDGKRKSLEPWNHNFI